MGENTRGMPQCPAIYLFSWEGEGVLASRSPTWRLFAGVLSDLPPAQNGLARHQKCMLELPRICIFFHEFRTFPVTEGNEI